MNIKAIWTKWHWIIILILAAIVTYQYIKPPDVQIVTQTKIKEKIVTKTITQIKYIVKKEVAKDVVVTTKITETKKPTGEVTTITETKTEDKSKINVSKDITTNVIATSNTQIDATQKIETTTITKRWFTTMTAYEFRGQRIMVGPGINLWDNFTIMAVGSYAVSGSPTFDYGVGLCVRF